MHYTMPRKSKLTLPALELGEETTGQRIARIRKERGYTQNELAERIGTIQALVSDYERDKLRLNAEMAVRFAIALEVSTDELLGLHSAATNGKKQAKSNGRKASRKSSAASNRSKLYPSISKPSCSRPSTPSSKLPANKVGASLIKLVHKVGRQDSNPQTTTFVAVTPCSSTTLA